MVRQFNRSVGTSKKIWSRYIPICKHEAISENALAMRPGIRSGNTFKFSDE